MVELTVEEMAEIRGGYEPREGSLDCAVAGASLLLNGFGIGVAAAIGPFGLLGGAYLVSSVAATYYGFVQACSS